MQEITLTSIGQAARFHQKQSASTRATFDVIVRLEDAYARAPITWTHPLVDVHVSRESPTTMGQWQLSDANLSDLRNELINRRKCSRLTFVRIDGDDALFQDYFAALQRVTPATLRGERELFLTGTSVLDQPILWSTGPLEAPVVSCTLERTAGPVFSLGASLTLGLGIWKSLNNTFDIFKSHKHFKAEWVKRAATLPQKPKVLFKNTKKW